MSSLDGMLTRAAAMRLRSTLWQACRVGDAASVESLLLRGVADAVEGGYSSLQMACGGDHAQCVRLLLAHGAAVDQVSGGHTALHHACLAGSASCVQLLLDYRASVDVIDSLGSSPLEVSCDSNDVACAQLLLAHGARCDLFNPADLSPLMVAVLRGAAACVRLLLERREDIVDLKNRAGVTSLMLSCASGQTACCELLLSHGASCDTACSMLSATALHLAVSNESPGERPAGTRLWSLQTPWIRFY